MKKKILFFITLLIASMFFIPKVFATEKEPTVLVVGEETVVIANGVNLTIVEPSEEDKVTYGAVIKYGDNKELKVPADAWVFGGTHNDNSTTVNSNITMEGGQIYAIVGGGLHKSNVDVSTITINGGTLKSVYGGGVASIFFDSPTAEEKTHNYNGNAEESTTRVGTAHIEINGGTLTKYIYGGGMGYSYTGNTFITVNGGNQSTAILTSGGANGYTGEATITINDGNIGTVQSVNRGFIDISTLTVEGGKIGTIYAGGADNDSTVTGTINAPTVIVKNGNVDELKIGTSGGPNNAATTAAVTYKKSSVNTIDQSTFSEDRVAEIIKLTFVANGKSESLEIPVGFAFNENEIESLKQELSKLLGNTGYKFDNFYADENCTKEYDMTSEFTTDTTVYIKLVQLREEEQKSQGVTNPNTSDINFYGIIITILLATIGLGYTIKKRKFN